MGSEEPLRFLESINRLLLGRLLLGRLLCCFTPATTLGVLTIVLINSGTLPQPACRPPQPPSQATASQPQDWHQWMAQHGTAGMGGTAGLAQASADATDDRLLTFLKSRIDQPSPAAGPSLGSLATVGTADAATLGAAATGGAAAAAAAAGTAAGAAAGTGSFAELEREMGSSTVVDFRDIQFIRMVGGSAFGKTYLARLHECDVACKVLLSAADPSAITGKHCCRGDVVILMLLKRPRPRKCDVARRAWLLNVLHINGHGSVGLAQGTGPLASLAADYDSATAPPPA